MSIVSYLLLENLHMHVTTFMFRPCSYVLPRIGVPNSAFHGHMKPEHTRVATVKKSQSTYMHNLFLLALYICTCFMIIKPAGVQQLHSIVLSSGIKRSLWIVGVGTEVAQ